MKKSILLFCVLLTATVFAQDKQSNRPLPKVDIKTMDGATINTSSFSNDGKPIVIDFWATWCKPCVEELDAIGEVYDEWQKKTGVKLITISLDDARTMQRVAPMVNARGWTYDSYVDPNGDFKRAMNVNMPPHIFVLNGNKEIIWQHVGFAHGDEDAIYEALKKSKK